MKYMPIAYCLSEMYVHNLILCFNCLNLANLEDFLVELTKDILVPLLIIDNIIGRSPY